MPLGQLCNVLDYLIILFNYCACLLGVTTNFDKFYRELVSEPSVGA